MRDTYTLEHERALIRDISFWSSEDTLPDLIRLQHLFDITRRLLQDYDELLQEVTMLRGERAEISHLVSSQSHLMQQLRQDIGCARAKIARLQGVARRWHTTADTSEGRALAAISRAEPAERAALPRLTAPAEGIGPAA